MKVTLLTGVNTYYELGLLSGLLSTGITVDYIGGDDVKDAELIRNQKNVSFYNFRGDQNPNASMKDKIVRILKHYAKLIRYAAQTDSKIFHIQWFNKFVYFDRVLLNAYYKILGKRLIFTAHNVNAGVRDGKDTVLNRVTLRFMYAIVDHIIVHTEMMKRQLMNDFNVSESKVSVVPHGVNDLVFQSKLTREQARINLGLEEREKVLLFFGIIKPYKGLEHLLTALLHLKESSEDFRLIIAGMIDKHYKKYWEKIHTTMKEYDLQDHVIQKIYYVPDEDVEIYFKAADVLILPYTYIFQSGLLFLAFNFGLPIIATDVGSMREYIIEGKTGFVCRAEDPHDLAEKIEMYYKSGLYADLNKNRAKIREYANEKYSWVKIAEKTYGIYMNLSRADQR